MSTDPDGYIYILGWDRFQHYSDRRPPWIKTYVDLLNNDAYLDLSPLSRALLHGLWLLTAEVGQGRVGMGSGRTLARLGLPSNLGRRAFDPLIQAGFIEVRASKAASETLAIRSTRVRETKRVAEQPSLSPDGAASATPSETSPQRPEREAAKTNGRRPPKTSKRMIEQAGRLYQAALDDGSTEQAARDAVLDHYPPMILDAALDRLARR